MFGVDSSALPLCDFTDNAPFFSVSLPSEPIVMPLHRIGDVRREQGMPLSTAAKRLGVDVDSAKKSEQTNCNLTLRDIYRWQRVLDVPCAELLVNPDEFPENPIRTRGQLVRLMKTTRSIIEQTKEESIRVFARMMIDQLTEIMPELKNVASWPTIGQSREFKDYGQAIYRKFDSRVSAVFEN